MTVNLQSIPNEQLIVLARTDPNAAEMALQRFEPFIWHFATKFGSNVPNEREDDLQEARIAFVMALRNWDPERGTRFSTFAVVCIRNALRHTNGRSEIIRRPGSATRPDVRAMTVISIGSIPGLETGPDESYLECLSQTDQFMEAVPCRVDLDRVLADMPSRDATAFRMHLNGAVGSGIAKALGCSITLVYQSLNRTRLRLRKTLDLER